MLRFFSFFQFFDKSVGPTDGFVDDGVDGIITEITVCTPASDDCTDDLWILISCSVIFLFILIYYNNEEKSVVLHSYSENYAFFHTKKTPTFRRVRKNMIKKIEEYLYLSLFSCSSSTIQQTRPDRILS